MLFNSLNYLLFFPIVFACFWLAPKKVRPFLLLVASYIFYMSWMPIYGLLLFFLTLANYIVGIAINKFQTNAKPLLVLGLVINLGTLCFFKYTNFLLQSLASVLTQAAALLHLNGINFDWLVTMAANVSRDAVAINIILPLGISFFAFEFIHYIVDIYRGDKPISNPIHFGLFAAFFPSQIAGPIKRYQDFIHQLHQELEQNRSFSKEKFKAGMTLAMQGLFKKVALSDNLSPLVARGFDGVQTIGAGVGTLDAWFAVLAFALQIYFDFSGYTDMGRGSALMLGFSLPDNFNLPYIASSASDFWKRWHISLSSWLRDYLYIPLGGGRVSRLRKHFNLMITMLLGGLWHGAAWHFVAWGGFHGAGLVVNHEYGEIADKSSLMKAFHSSKIGKFTSALLTLAFVLVGWVLFRAQTMSQAYAILSLLFQSVPSQAVVSMLAQSTLPYAIGVYIIYAILFANTSVYKPAPVVALRNALDVLPARVAIWACVFICAIGFSPSHAEPFIYFQF